MPGPTAQHARLAARLRQVEHDFYLAGLIQGREDAVAGRASRLPKLWESDTALRRGYVQGYDGMRLAVRNDNNRGRA